MSNYKVKNAILLATYKRLDTTKQVFDGIRKVQPSRLYIASDFSDKPEEQQLVLSVREFLDNAVDWDCDVKKIYRNKHLGAKEGISSAVSYFFENEEQGIILEDDTVPNTSFFRFCDEMLERYKNNENIFMVSGWSALDFDKHAKESLKYDYFFSKYNHIWGWASWARAWKLYQKEFVDFKQEFKKLDVFIDSKERRYWYKTFKAQNEAKFDAWDYPFTYTIWKHKGLSVYPKNNMIKNIGFNRSDATHTLGESKFENVKTYELDFPLTHPKEIAQNKELDYKDFLISFAPPPFHIRVCNKLKRMAKKLFKN